MTTPDPQEEAPPELTLPPRWQQPPTAEPPATRRPSGAAALALGLILAVAIAGVAASPFWAPALAPLLPWGEHASAAAPDTVATAELQTRLDTAEATLKQQTDRLQRLAADAAALKQRAAQPAPPPAPAKAVLSDAQLFRLDGDEQILKDMANRIAALEKRTATPAQNPQSAAAIKALQGQVAKLASGTAATDDRLAKLQGQLAQAKAGERAGEALLLALANLRVAAEGAAPYSVRLAAAEALAGDDAGLKERLATLRGGAKAGLPSTAMLAQRFDRSVASAILRAPRNSGNEGWWQQIWARLERLVVIRRIAADGTLPRDPTEAAVARAGAALRAGDLAAAVAALEPLTGASAQAAAPWLAEAKRRLATDATLAAAWHDAVAKSEAKP